MEIKHEWEHGPELLFISGADETLLARVKAELGFFSSVLRDPEKTGGATRNGENSKKNKGVFLNEVYTELGAEVSPAARLFSGVVEAIKAHQFTPASVFNLIHSMEGFNILYSAYGNGDYYDPHRDHAKITILYWSKNADFSGGDLIFPDFNVTIPFEENKIIAFPSFYYHEVTKVVSDPEEEAARVVLSAFCL